MRKLFFIIIIASMVALPSLAKEVSLVKIIGSVSELKQSEKDFFLLGYEKLEQKSKRVVLKQASDLYKSPLNIKGMKNPRIDEEEYKKLEEVFGKDVKIITIELFVRAMNKRFSSDK
jgi:hypothetical protein